MTDAADLPAIVLISQSDWGLAWVFAHDLASHFAESGHPVVYLNPFPKRFPRPNEWRRLLGRLLDRPRLTRFAAHRRPPGLVVQTPLTLPDLNRFFTWLNRRLLLPWLKKKVLAACAGRNQRLVFVFLPFATPVAFADMLAPAQWIYARRDDYGDDPNLRHLLNLEDEISKRADLVITAGKMLAAKCRGLEHKVLNIPGLVDFPSFFRPVAGKTADDPLCCYFGHVNERVDLPLLLMVGKHYRLRIIGTIGSGWPVGAPGEILGMVPYDRVPDMLSTVDVVVIPYRLTGFSRSIFPYKIFQAFAQGKPIVATRLPALEHFSHLLYLASSPEEFLAQIGLAAAEGIKVKLQRQEVARRHDRRLVLEPLRQRLLDGSLRQRPACK
jgi:glycosyltransferase involved in cell wall biosynthesis